ncbi:MAG: NAD+ synthase [Candidatus Aminicenantes bacterium]|nr:NAD+ synthase [Candidatus Aminicenantes bacterium]
MKINPAFVEEILTAFIREELGRAGFHKGILGLSGGLDSAVCATLAVRALGPRNVTALIMPYGKGFGSDLADARRIAKALKLQAETIDISPMVDAYFKKHPTDNPVLKGNKMARERMTILYDWSARIKALVLGTSNKSELLIGYGTIHGDLACAFNPLGDLYKTQVRALAEHLGLPEDIRTKAPSACLWPGQTDEAEIGLSYAELDEILEHLVDGRESEDEVVARGFPRKKAARIARLIRGSEFKRQMPPIAKLSSRTVGHDHLYPYDGNK